MNFEVSSIKSLFNLNEQDQVQIEKCVNGYSKNGSVSHAIFSLFGQSDWQKARKILADRALTIVETKFSIDNPDANLLNTRAKALSEFVLKFLVTKKSIADGQPKFLIPEQQLQEMAEMSPMDILERATYGNGTLLEDSPRQYLVPKLRSQREVFIRNVNIFDNYLQYITADANNLKTLMKTFLGSSMPASRDGPQENMKNLINHMREVIRRTKYIENDDVLKQQSLKKLNEAFIDLEKIHQSFCDCLDSFRRGC